MSAADPIGPETSAAQPRKAALLASLVVAIGGTFSLVMHRMATTTDDIARRERITEVGEQKLGAIQRRVEREIDILHALASFINVRGRITQSEFRSFVTGTLLRSGSSRTVLWLPRVTGVQRPAFQEEARASGHSLYKITEIAADGQFVKRREQSEYYPILHAFPGNASHYLGFDVVSSAERREVMEQARDRGTPLATGAIRLQNRAALVELYLPVFRRTGAEFSAVDRRRELRGFLSVWIDPEDIVAATLQEAPLPDLALRILDTTAQPQQVLATFPSTAGIWPVVRTGRALEDAPWGRVIDIGGRQWSVTCSLHEDGAKLADTWRPLTILLGGLATSLLLGWHIASRAHQIRQVEHIVKQRTDDLRQANLVLAEENLRRRNTEAALRESQARLQAILDHSTVMIYLKDTAGRYIVVNAAFTRAFGLESSAIIGKTDRDVFPADMAERWRQHDMQVISECKPLEFEEEATTRTRGNRVFLALKFPVSDGEASPSAVGGIATDITERKEVDRLKDELVSTVSHELRTPLTSLRGFAELMLQREFAPEKQREFLRIIHKESVRLNDLINDFLDLRRMQSRCQNYEFQRVDLQSLLRDVGVLFSQDEAQHRVSLQVPDEPLLVRADPNRISQTLTNLVSNAMKFSPPKSEIVIRAERADNEIAISVIDQGVGIASEDLAKLFQHFVRIRSDVTRHIGGTGLGLAVVKEIVEAHHGRVEVQSEVGKGSCFTIRLPCEPEAGAKDVRSLDLTGETNVLLIEDDANFAHLMQEQMAVAGLSVAVTAHGEEALARLRSRPPDLVLLDISLGEALDGWDLLIAMRRDPRLDAIPVFVFSEVHEMNAGGLAAAGAGWLHKPIDEQALQRQIKNCAPRHIAPNQVIVVSRDEELCDLVARCLAIGPDVDFQRPSLGEALARMRPEVLLVIVDVGKAGAKIVAVMERLRATRAALNLSFILVGEQQPTPAEQACLQRSMASVVGKQEATLQPFANMARQIVTTQKRQREAVGA